MASDGRIVLWGWEREGGQCRIVLTIWSATGSEQQPRGLFKDAISIDGIFKQTQIRSRRRISFQTLEGRSRRSRRVAAVQTIKSSMTMA